MEQPRAADINHKRKMGKLKDSIFAHLAALNPSKTLAPHVLSHIEQKLPQLIPSHTPTHPPYSSMIERAIRELKEEGGSSGVAISEFLLREFEDLPWGHESFLTHHLEKLCRSKDIVRTNDGCYMLPVQSSDSRDIDKRGKKRLHKQNDVIEGGLVSQKMSCERNQVQGRQTALTERVNAAERQLVEATEMQIEVQLEAIETQHGKRQSITNLVEENFPQELDDEVIRDQRQLHEQKVGVSSKMVVSCNGERSGGSADMSVQCGELPLSMVIVQKKKKQLRKKSASKPWEVSICCGLMARSARPKVSRQLRQSKSHLGKKAAALELQMCSDQQVELFSSDKLKTNGKENTGVSSLSVPEHCGQWPPKRQGQDRLPMHPYQGMLPRHPVQLWPPQHQGRGKSPTLKHYARRTTKGICNEQGQQ